MDYLSESRIAVKLAYSKIQATFEGSLPGKQSKLKEIISKMSLILNCLRILPEVQHKEKLEGLHMRNIVRKCK